MRNPIISIITIASLNIFCTGIQLTSAGVKNELAGRAASIRENRKEIYSLDRIRIGREGFFYILKKDGVIAYHPKKGLIGSDFSRYSFVGRILKERNGCFSHSIGGVTRYIFFTEIDSGEILCISIDANDLSGDKGCATEDTR